MPQKKVYIETVGCQMNVLDSELVIGALRKQGYDLTDSPAEADVLLFNTCSVREHAEEKTYSSLGRVRRVRNQQRRWSALCRVIGRKCRRPNQPPPSAHSPPPSPRQSHAPRVGIY